MDTFVGVHFGPSSTSTDADHAPARARELVSFPNYNGITLMSVPAVGIENNATWNLKGLEKMQGSAIWTLDNENEH